MYKGITKPIIFCLFLSLSFFCCEKPSDEIDKGVLINGVKWATRNVDAPGKFAANPEDAGMFYQWNRKTGWSTTDPLVNHEGGTTWDSSIPEGGSWEKANDPCPTGWRIPTLEEQQSLFFDREWATLNGVNGCYFGSGKQRVFFPAAGARARFDSIGTLYDVGIYGNYWNTEKWYMYFKSNDGCWNPYPYNSGVSVRCVAK